MTLRFRHSAAHIEKVSLPFIRDHAAAVMASSPIPYVRDAELRGSLFDSESGGSFQE